MSSILIKGALTSEGIVDVRVQGNRLVEIALSLSSAGDDNIVEAEGLLLYPGLVNTHHHLAQSILKGVPAAIESDLDDWLPQVPFAAWPHMTADTLYAAARIGFAELLRSGCTTCADHHYIYDPNTSDEMEDALFQAADELGIRFVLCRGSATSSGTHRGLNMDRIESLELWEKRMFRTMKHHDSNEDAMRRLVVAPTSLIHSSGPDHLRYMADFARENHLLMHSHLLEVQRDEVVAQEVFGCSAIDFAESVEWLGPDVWFAHLVHANQNDIKRLAMTGTGIAHCPVSNCRLGSGVADVPEMQKQNQPISIGVDGSASAESGSMVNEMMQAWLVHRAVQGPEATSVDDVVSWGTTGGAEILGLDVGRLEVGSVADLVLFDLNHPRFYGVWEPYQSPVICGEPIRANRVMVNGQWVVEDGTVLGLDYDQLRKDAEVEAGRLQSLMT